MKSFYKFMALLLLVSFILIGCGTDGKNNQQDGKLLIYSTVYPLQDFAEKIGGNFVEVKTVYPPGSDEHTYEPSQKEIIDMAESDLFFYIGYGLEGFVEKIKPILSDEGVKAVAVGETVNFDAEYIGYHNELDYHEHGHEEGEEYNGDEHSHEDGEDHGNANTESGHSEDGHHHGDINPHLWLDPVYAGQMAHTILDILIEAIPEQKEYFESNYEGFLHMFESLNQEFADVASKAENKSFIVSHSAYDYWETRYGLKQLSVAGLSTSEEPSQKQLIEIIDEVNEKNLKYILVEQNVDNKLVNVIQKEAKVSSLPIHNLSILTHDDIQEERDYFSIMESNLETLKQALNVK